MPMSLVGWVLRGLKIVPVANDHEVWLLCVTRLAHLLALRATCLDSEVNVTVVFVRRFGLLDEYCPSVSKCLQDFDATYVVEWDGVCKGLLRGEVKMFQTFVVGNGAEDHAKQDQESDHYIEDCSTPKTATPPKAPKPGIPPSGVCLLSLMQRVGKPWHPSTVVFCRKATQAKGGKKKQVCIFVVACTTVWSWF